jgi:hypothetical protein
MNILLKKAGNIIVIFFLLIATGGIPITRHYCGYSLVSFSLFSNPESCCAGDCDKCHNDFSYQKVTDNFSCSHSEVVKPVIITNLFQSDFVAELSALSISAYLPILNTSKKFLFFNSGDIPVALGNFRC